LISTCMIRQSSRNLNVPSSGVGKKNRKLQGHFIWQRVNILNFYDTLYSQLDRRGVSQQRRVQIPVPGNGVRTHHHHHCCWYRFRYGLRRLFGWFIVSAQTQPLIQAFVPFVQDTMIVSWMKTCQRAGRRL
jgi:hypothetical protein